MVAGLSIKDKKKKAYSLVHSSVPLTHSSVPLSHSSVPLSLSSSLSHEQMTLTPTLMSYTDAVVRAMCHVLCGPSRVQVAKSRILAPAVSSTFLRAFGGADMQAFGGADLQGPSGSRPHHMQGSRPHHMQGPSGARAHQVSVYSCRFCRRAFKSQHAGAHSVGEHTRCKCIQLLSSRERDSYPQENTFYPQENTFYPQENTFYCRKRTFFLCTCACGALALCRAG